MFDPQPQRGGTGRRHIDDLLHGGVGLHQALEQLQSEFGDNLLIVAIADDVKLGSPKIEAFLRGLHRALHRSFKVNKFAARIHTQIADSRVFRAVSRVFRAVSRVSRLRFHLFRACFELSRVFRTGCFACFALVSH